MTTAWTSDAVDRIDPATAACVPPVGAPVPVEGGEGRWYWDMWPVQGADGRIAPLGGREMWMALAAPDRGDPAARHFVAKICWLERVEGGWADRSDVLPPIPVPYEREWAGSALHEAGRVTLFFTGAGTADRPGGYQQALFEAGAPVDPGGRIGPWSPPASSLAAPREHYMPADTHKGEAGRIKALRDPAWFRDPADGAEYLVFTASLAGACSQYNGAVGIARRGRTGWEPLPPLVHADGVNNELERAHAVFHAGRYYVFWSTQRHTFAPELRHAPTGLYGMVADSLFGPYRPLNGGGLVLANPDDAPAQTYSWFVSRELVVSSFVDALPGTCTGAAAFGGVPAPLLRLVIDGDRCALAKR